MDTNKKRVSCLYRVSTRMQVEEDDIPMQKNACREFIEKQKGWNLEKEYAEKGVSGYKLSSSKRDVLQQVREDAEKKKFDVLLVFMFDRLGRREDEIPFIVEWFVKKGIEVWSVKEGQQRFDSRVDKLINYIRYWQSGGESEKTSIRVTEKHTQMVKEGLFRGGVPPYGYKLVKSGVINKKGKEISKLAIDEEESKVVKLAYELAYEQGYGGYRIAKQLNVSALPPRKGNSWGEAVINYMLRNPIYKGYMTYGKTTYKAETQGRVKPEEWILSEKPVEELIIIPEEIWNKVQKIRASRTPDCYRAENLDHDSYPLQTKSPLMFVGFIKCGHCGYALNTAYHKCNWTTKNGPKKDKMKPVYRCSGRSSGKVGCDGQSTYSKERIEGIVMEEIYKYLDQLKQVDLTEKIAKLQFDNMENEQRELKTLLKKNDEGVKELEILKEEVTKSILGKSAFRPELLSSLIEEKEAALEALRTDIDRLKSILQSKKLEINDMSKLQRMIPVWREEFDKAPNEKKKMMLVQIIDDIVVYRDKIEINVKLHINEFLGYMKDNNLQEQNMCNGRFP